jgi:hypothetical protein
VEWLELLVPVDHIILVLSGLQGKSYPYPTSNKPNLVPDISAVPFFSNGLEKGNFGGDQKKTRLP